VILEKGLIVGTWEVRKSGAIVLSPFGKLTKMTLTSLQGHVAKRYHGLLGDPTWA
jgi:hypothetical protein